MQFKKIERIIDLENDGIQLSKCNCSFCQKCAFVEGNEKLDKRTFSDIYSKTTTSHAESLKEKCSSNKELCNSR
jgi:hypothetical protein